MNFSKQLKLAYAFLLVTCMACSDDDDYTAPVAPPAAPAVATATIADHGQILVTEEGFSLYMFAFDVAGDANCNDGCAAAWPPYFKEDLTLSADLEAADFGEITRQDGSKQLTYKGWPLYEFANDSNPGDVNGDGLGPIWHVAKPDYTVMIGAVTVDDVTELFLTDPIGNTLYNFLQDGPAESNCSGGCVTVWPLFQENGSNLPSSLYQGALGTFTREDGEIQRTFNDKPMYFFTNDESRGERNGHIANDQFDLFDDSQFSE